MRWDLALDWVSWLRIFDLSEVENLSLFLLEEIMCELINSLYVEVSSKGLNWGSWLELIPGPVHVTNVLETWLGYLEVFRNLLSLH